MLLWELNENELLVKLVAIASKVRHAIEHGQHRKKPWMQDVDSFLDYLAQHDINIDQQVLDDMISQGRGPLSQVITGIDGDKIQWNTGDESEEMTQGDAEITTDLAAADAEFQQKQNDQIVSDMAKKALPK